MISPRYLTRLLSIRRILLPDPRHFAVGNSPVGGMQQLFVVVIVIPIFDHVRNATTFNVRTPVKVMTVIPAAAWPTIIVVKMMRVWKPNCWHPGTTPGGIIINALEFHDLSSIVLKSQMWEGGGRSAWSVGRNTKCACNTRVLFGWVGGCERHQTWVHFGSSLFWHPPTHNHWSKWCGFENPIVGIQVQHLGASSSMHWSSTISAASS